MLRNFLSAAQIQIVVALLFFLMYPSAKIEAQDTLRIATYNVLKFPGITGPARLDDFRKVVQALDPDILILQELEDQSGYNNFLSQVLNFSGNTYGPVPFLDGPDTDSGLFIKLGTSANVLAVDLVITEPRNIFEYILIVNGEDLSIFSLHLKAGSTASDQNRRLNATNILRDRLDQLGAGSNFIVVGDFNVRSASEASFQKLIEDQPGNSGRSFDPINQLGNWNNNSFFAFIHSQSTRTSNFGDGASGGLDDRFDFILVSRSILDPGGIRILPSTYRSFGNDADHFNQAINVGSNFAVPDSVADALHEASDHLPVFAEFIFGDLPTSVKEDGAVPSQFSLQQNFPNPFNPATEIKFTLSKAGKVQLMVFNLLGEQVAVLVDEFRQSGQHQVAFDASALPSGIYVYRLSTGPASVSKKLLLLR